VNVGSKAGLAFCAALLAPSAATAAPSATLRFRDAAAEISAASRLLSGYGVVTSTFRSVAHNKAVGGVPNSYHLLDRAIDVARRAGVSHNQLEAALRRAGYQLIESLDEQDHSHFAFAALHPPKPQVTNAAAPTATPVKPLPKVAADEHGTLVIDLVKDQPETSSEATAR
jgi:hypothetical protein